MNGVTSRSRTVFRTLQRFKRTGSGVRRRFRPPYEAVRGGNFLFVNWKYVNGPIQKKKEISILHTYQFPHLSPTRLQYYVFSLQKVPHLFPHLYNITYFHCTYYLAGQLSIQGLRPIAAHAAPPVFIDCRSAEVVPNPLIMNSVCGMEISFFSVWGRLHIFSWRKGNLFGVLYIHLTS